MNNEYDYKRCKGVDTPHLVEPGDINEGHEYCHACDRLLKWKLENSAKVNTRIELAPRGHWKAYLEDESPFHKLVASGHIRSELVASPEAIGTIANAIHHSIEKEYKPDKKHRFVGLMYTFYTYIDYDVDKLNRILIKSRQNSLLPTLWMKAPQWKLWYPLIDYENPQLRNQMIKLGSVKDYYTEEESNNVVLLPQTNAPFIPHRFRFLESGRYLIELVMPDNRKFIADIDVSLK